MLHIVWSARCGVFAESTKAPLNLSVRVRGFVTVRMLLDVMMLLT